MRIQIELDPNEHTSVTPLMFAQMAIDYWLDGDLSIQGEAYGRINLRESARHIIEFLNAEEGRLEIKRSTDERCPFFE